MTVDRAKFSLRLPALSLCPSQLVQCDCTPRPREITSEQFKLTAKKNVLNTESLCAAQQLIICGFYVGVYESVQRQYC